MSTPDFESMTVEDTALWLEEQGVPSEYCEKFSENYIDGTEFTKLTDSEIRAMVAPIGLAKKIMRLIPKEEHTSSIPFPSPHWSPPLFSSPTSASHKGKESSTSVTPTSPRSPLQSESGSTIPVSESDDSISVTSLSGLEKKFTIPDSWPPSIMYCINQDTDDARRQALVPSVRSEIVRVLANNMFCHDHNPKKEFCTRVAKMLVKKYKFMRDVGEQVSGYGSWEKKLIDKIHNTKSRGKRPNVCGDESTPKAKRGRPRISTLLTRYPPIRNTEDDEVTLYRNREELKKEVQRERPRKDVVLSLARQTYAGRRASVLSEAEDVCVTSLLCEFQELRRPYVLEQEIDLILEKKGVLADAHHDWCSKWMSAILKYSDSLSGKKGTLASQTRKACEGDACRDDKAALELLCMLFQKKNVHNSFVYIYEEYEMTDDPDEVAAKPPLRTAPRIGFFNGDEPQYFLYVENRALFYVNSLSRAIMFWFILHYIFNLEYCAHVKSVALFFQEFVFKLPATSFLKHHKTATYLTITTDIQKYV